METNLKEIIGHKIKTFRELRSYDQKSMATKLGISQPEYSNIEKGNVSLVIDRLFQIAEILGVKVNTILDFDDSKVFNIYTNTTEKGVINGFVFQEGISEGVKTLYEKLLAEKDERIQQLKAENEELKGQRGKKG
jgi:transcriptional regulator with XRE-family HTH domain